MKFTLNSRSVAFDGDGQTPLLWVLRDHFKLLFLDEAERAHGLVWS